MCTIWMPLSAIITLYTKFYKYIDRNKNHMAIRHRNFINFNVLFLFCFGFGWFFFSLRLFEYLFHGTVYIIIYLLSRFFFVLDSFSIWPVQCSIKGNIFKCAIGSILKRNTNQSVTNWYWPLMKFNTLDSFINPFA